MASPENPLIVQSDKTLLLEVDHPLADACRQAEDRGIEVTIVQRLIG